MHRSDWRIGAALILLASPAAAEPPVLERIVTRSYPAVFEAWNPAENLYDKSSETPLNGSESADQTLARHDLAFVTLNALGLRTKTPGAVLSTEFDPKSIETALARRAKILEQNPNFVLLASISYRNAPSGRLPEDSPLWLRDAAGQHVPTRAGQIGKQDYIDYRKSETQDAIAAHCRALIATRVFDGCMFDWWGEHISDDPVDRDGEFRRQLIARVRAVAGDQAILVGNTNDKRPEKTAPYMNGMYMEGFGAAYFQDWRVAAEDLAWGGAHLHKPAFNLLEGWPTDAQGRADLSRMREVTTLTLTLSNGYALFADRNQGKVDHAHDWYPFWSAKLGRPKEPPQNAEAKAPFHREFEHGTAVFNPPEAAPAKFSFPDERISAATGERGREFTIAPADGDLFLRP